MTDDELNDWEEGLRREVLRRIGHMMAALDPHDLTLEECRELFRLVRSFTDKRGGDEH